jgi:hypothetical protein
MCGEDQGGARHGAVDDRRAGQEQSRLERALASGAAMPRAYDIPKGFDGAPEPVCLDVPLQRLSSLSV